MKQQAEWKEEDSKRCPACGNWKPLSDFGKHGTNATGYQSYCKLCSKEYHHRKATEAARATRKEEKKRLMAIDAVDCESCVYTALCRFKTGTQNYIKVLIDKMPENIGHLVVCEYFKMKEEV